MNRQKALFPLAVFMGFVFLVCFVLAGCGGGSYQNTSTISGTITDSNGEPISGAEVGISINRSTTTTIISDTTGADGKYTLSGVPLGEHTLTVVCQGYQNYSQKVTISSSRDTINVISVERLAEIAQLDPLEFKG